MATEVRVGKKYRAKKKLNWKVRIGIYNLEKLSIYQVLVYRGLDGGRHLFSFGTIWIGLSHGDFDPEDFQEV